LSQATDRNGLDYRVALTYKIDDKQYACVMQIDSKGMRNISAGSNISQAVGVWISDTEKIQYTIMNQVTQILPEVL